MNELTSNSHEQEFARGRTHPKALVPPVAALMVLGLLWRTLDARSAQIVEVAAQHTALAVGLNAASVQLVLAAVCLVAGLYWVVRPMVRWVTSQWVLTSERIITRTGLIWQSGHDLPLSRIANVETERGLLDRLFGCGTLILTTAAVDPLRLVDIPNVEQVKEAVAGLAGGAVQRPTDSRIKFSRSPEPDSR